MAVYVVTWNLNKEGSAYTQARDVFLRHLAKYQNTKDTGLETVRFISTAESAKQIDEYLRQKLDTNDRLFVSKLNSGEYQGWLDTSVWEWISARL